MSKVDNATSGIPRFNSWRRNPHATRHAAVKLRMRRIGLLQL